MGKVDNLYLENLNEFVFDEKKIVTYKYLAVTLDVHVNTAKQMLYTFYTREKQKKKKIYATYFLSGFAPAHTFRDKDEPMDVDQESGIHDEQFIILCGCDKLEETKSKFTKLLSVHVYAVSASPVEDFQELKSPDNLTKNSSPHQKPTVYKAYVADEDLSSNTPSSSKSTRSIANVSPESPHRKSMVKTESQSPLDDEHSDKIAFSKRDAATKSPPHKKRLFDFNTPHKSDKKKNQKSSSSKSSKSKTNTRQQKLSFKPDSAEKYMSREPPPKRKGQTDGVKNEVCESDSEEDGIQEITPSPYPPPRRSSRVSKRQTANMKKSQPGHRNSTVCIESDSDNLDDDDVEADSPPRRKTKTIESDSDDNEDSIKVQSPLKQQRDQQKEQEESLHGKKHIAKMISKTFTAEDGYLVTNNVRELMSDDEDKGHLIETEVEEVKDTTPHGISSSETKKTKSQDVILVKSSNKTYDASKKRKQPTGSQSKSKQQSITNFFKPK